jgi:hypothetical protein
VRPARMLLANSAVAACRAVRFVLVSTLLFMALLGTQETVLGSPQATGAGFQVAPTIAVGTGPQAIAVADLNGDGNPDLVVGECVLLGNGDGTFQSPGNCPAGGSSIAIADLNGDGKPDLVVGGESAVTILLGMGNGTFQTPYTYATAGGQAVVGDFNGDGKLDIATSGGTVLLGNGNGTFRMGQSFSTVGLAVAAADFNGDGKLDLVVTDFNGNANILIGNGNGTFQTGAAYGVGLGWPVSAVAVGDFNNDGHLDFVVSTQGGGIAEEPETGIQIFLGNGNGTFTSAPIYSTGGYDEFYAGTTSVSVGDFNGDGKPDVAVTRPYAGILVYIGVGDGTFLPPIIWGPPSLAVAVGDFDKNGELDMAAISASGNKAAILLGNGDGTFRAESSYFDGFPSAVPVSIVTGDFNGDGKQDMEVVSDVEFEGITPLESLLGNGDGTFQYFTAQGFTASFAVCGEAAGDFNRDGKEDLAISDCNNGVEIYLGQGNGTFQSFGGAYGSGSGPVAVGDVNGDGSLDLLSGNGTLDVSLGNGDGTFQPTMSYACGTGCGFIRLGDFNGDGKGDVAAADGNSNVNVLLGNGNGTFQPAVTYPVGRDPVSITAGDFNGDGKLDLAVACQDGIYLLLGGVNGTFQAAVVVGPPSVSVASADINGDGKLDLITSNTGEGISVLYGNGDGTFQLPVTYEQGSSLGFLRVGDFNGDGAPDVAVGNEFEAMATVFMNKGGTFITTTTSESSLSFDEPVTFTANVAASVKGSGLPTGTVTFKDSSTTLGTEPLVSGEANITVLSLSVGTHTITAVYSGDSNFNPHTGAPLTQRVQQAATETSIASSANPSIPEQPVTFTATVSSLTSGIPTGKVTFSNGGSTTYGVASVNPAGQAKLTISNLKTGISLIGAVYGGDSNFTGSSSEVIMQFVQKLATTTVVTSSLNPATIGQSVTFTAAVSGSTGAPPNGETVTFKNGPATLGTGTLSGGVAQFTTSSLPAGTASILASYPGDTTLLPSNSAVFKETVNNNVTTVALASNANPSSYGQSVTFTATVSAGSGGTPGGTVTFKNGSSTLGTANLNGGTASLATTTLTVGTHSIAAVYGGDGTHAGSTSSALSQVVNKAATTTALTSSQNPSTSGQSVTFTATVTSSTSGTPTGAVIFKAGTKALGSATLSGGKASISTTALAAGSDTITATYNGSANFTGSSGTLTQVVN